MRIALIIPAAGRGERLGAGRPKAFVEFIHITRMSTHELDDSPIFFLEKGQEAKLS